MAVGVLTTVVVFDRDLYKPGHMVHRWMTLVTTHFVGHAIADAPVRSGELKAGISGDTNQVGDRQVEGTISSSAPHTLYVLRGTTGPIMSNRRWANPEGAYSKLWGSINPKTGKFTRRHIKGAERKQITVRNKGFWLRVRSGPEFDQHFALQVRGQEANNFLERAWRQTARNHRAIRGRAPSFIRNP